MSLKYRTRDQTHMKVSSLSYGYADEDLRKAISDFPIGYAVCIGYSKDARNLYDRAVLRAYITGAIPTCSTVGTHVRNNIATLPSFYGNYGFVFADVSFQESSGHFVGNGFQNGNNSNASADIKWDVTTGGVFRVSNGIPALSGGNIFAVVTYLSSSSSLYVGDKVSM